MILFYEWTEFFDLRYTVDAMPKIQKIAASRLDFWEGLGLDCIWICLPESQNTLPQHRLLHHLDWKLGGMLTRHLRSTERDSTFIATGGRISAPFLAVDFVSSTNVELFCQNAESMNFSRVLILTTTPNLPLIIENELKQFQSSVSDWLWVGGDTIQL
ncbi:MAG: hypothetical protein EB078_05340 [Proteobacteria bacterium]|nr:hypothetical protein [Pseudomonadota bacterium]NDD04309.1 hypothetical protein [Pseudomonadota bacterium]NDG27522.1 hypothetical protein [Pseudomonadota bacterium]